MARLKLSYFSTKRTVSILCSNFMLNLKYEVPLSHQHAHMLWMVDTQKKQLSDDSYLHHMSNKIFVL